MKFSENSTVFAGASEDYRPALPNLKAATACRKHESTAVRVLVRNTNESSDGRPPLVVAMQWVTQITTVSLEMALPAGLGYLGDERWGTEPWLVSVGAVLGFAVGLRHLLRMLGKKQSPEPPKQGKPDP